MPLWQGSHGEVEFRSNPPVDFEYDWRRRSPARLVRPLVWWGTRVNNQTAERLHSGLNVEFNKQRSASEDCPVMHSSLMWHLVGFKSPRRTFPLRIGIERRNLLDAQPRPACMHDAVTVRAQQREIANAGSMPLDQRVKWLRVMHVDDAAG